MRYHFENTHKSAALINGFEYKHRFPAIWIKIGEIEKSRKFRLNYRIIFILLVFQIKNGKSKLAFESFNSSHTIMFMFKEISHFNQITGFFTDFSAKYQYILILL